MPTYFKWEHKQGGYKSVHGSQVRTAGVRQEIARIGSSRNLCICRRIYVPASTADEAQPLSFPAFIFATCLSFLKCVSELTSLSCHALIGPSPCDLIILCQDSAALQPPSRDAAEV